MESFDVVYIGGGPGGYTGAIRAAQLGFKTAVVEKGKTLGGTCLNVGCIPSKAMLESSEHYSQALHELGSHGIQLGSVTLDLKTLLSRKDKVVKELTGGIVYLFKKHKVTWLQGAGKLLSPTQIEVKSDDGKTQTIEAKHIVLATGSVPNELPSVPFNGKNIISSTEALNLPQVPKHLVVIGGGVIGLELGSVWARLGAKVTVLEYFGRLCPAMDQQMTEKLRASLTKQGLEFLFEVKVTGAKASQDSVEVTYEDLKDKTQKSISGDVVLVATGRKPFSEGLGLETVGITKDKRGTVEVNEHFQTQVPNIYAIGDLVRGPMLAHKAEEEGVAIAEILAGHAGHVNYETVPNVIYTWPELASVGATEEELKAKAVEFKTGTFPFSANGRAKTMAMTDGLVKVIADAHTDRLLGVHILGPRASDMLQEAVVAMEFGGSSEDLARTFHAHPTLSEALREAALNVEKRSRQS